VAAHGEDFVILAFCSILTQYSSVTDIWTDRRPGHG